MDLLKKQKSLTIFKLVMMCVIAIDSLKNLPINAQYGSSILIFYCIAIFTFFLPSALVCAELATSFPHTGGVYIWVREAFGKSTAFLMVWIQWMIAIIWYPTILSFIAVTLAYFINPDWEHNKFYILLTALISFWFAMFGIFKGIRISSVISTVCAMLGVIIPMVFISLLGLYWIYLGNPREISFAISAPHFQQEQLRLFITLLYSLMGMEMIATHAGDVTNPEKQYPKALWISAFIILATVIPASLAISIVIPSSQIGLLNGVIAAFQIFLAAFHLTWLNPVIVILIAVGSFGIFYTWLLNSMRCLHIAALDGCLPPFFQSRKIQLLTQGTIFSVIATVFIWLPSVNIAFWFLTASCAELALIYYIVIFASALYLRIKKPEIQRPFRVGKHPAVLWVVCLVPITTCFLAILFGFLPPAEINPEKIFSYEAFLTTLIVMSIGTGVLIFKKVSFLSKHL